MKKIAVGLARSVEVKWRRQVVQELVGIFVKLIQWEPASTGEREHVVFPI